MSLSPPGLRSLQDKLTFCLVPMAEVKHVFPKAPCRASERLVTVSILIAVENTNNQLALILMKLKWTDYK